MLIIVEVFSDLMYKDNPLNQNEDYYEKLVFPINSTL